MKTSSTKTPVKFLEIECIRCGEKVRVSNGCYEPHNSAITQARCEKSGLSARMKLVSELQQQVLFVERRKDAVRYEKDRLELAEQQLELLRSELTHSFSAKNQKLSEKKKPHQALPPKEQPKTKPSGSTSASKPVPPSKPAVPSNPVPPSKLAVPSKPVTSPKDAGPAAVDTRSSSKPKPSIPPRASASPPPKPKTAAPPAKVSERAAGAAAASKDKVPTGSSKKTTAPAKKDRSSRKK